MIYDKNWIGLTRMVKIGLTRMANGVSFLASHSSSIERTSSILGKLGTAPVHRTPLGHKMRKINCISQKTWNRLRVWLRENTGIKDPAAALGLPGGRGRPRAAKWWTKEVDSGVSQQVKQRDAKSTPTAVRNKNLLHHDLR